MGATGGHILVMVRSLLDTSYNLNPRALSSPGSHVDSSESTQQNNWSRRGSYYAGTNGNNQKGPQNGYYGGRSQSNQNNGNRDSVRSDSYYHDNNNNIPEYNGNGNGGPSNNYNPNRSRYPRTQSDPQYGNGNGNGQGVYPMTGNQQSYETVTSGSSGEPLGYTTDPSSENSSLDRVQPIQNREPGENYGFNGFGGNPQLQPVGAGLNTNPYKNQGSVLRKEAPAGRGPIQLGSSTNGNGPAAVEPTRPEPEKRKSFFKRFSRSS